MHLKLWKPLNEQVIPTWCGIQSDGAFHQASDSCLDTHALVEGINYMPSHSHSTNYIVPSIANLKVVNL